MNRAMLWTGGALVVLGAGVFVMFILPWIGGAGSDAAAGTSGHSVGGPSVLAVAVASIGLAAGSALVGIGLGRWKRPKPSPHDGSPEI